MSGGGAHSGPRWDGDETALIPVPPLELDRASGADGPPWMPAAVRLVWHAWRGPRRRVWQIWSARSGHNTPIVTRRNRFEALRWLGWYGGVAIDVITAARDGHPRGHPPPTDPAAVARGVEQGWLMVPLVPPRADEHADA